MWTCADGRKVLFNRFYVPIAERPSSTALATLADPFKWVKWKRRSTTFTTVLLVKQSAATRRQRFRSPPLHEGVIASEAN
jgi:hypothetical protein